jgi:hypothetical protein
VSWRDRVGIIQGFVALVDTQDNVIAAGQNACNWGDCFNVPAVAGTGSDWGVVWENDGLSAGGTDVGFRLMDADGTSLTDPVALSTNGSSWSPVVAWDGARFGVAYATRTGAEPRRVVFLLVESDGTVSHAPRNLAVAQNTPSPCTPALAWAVNTTSWLGGNQTGAVPISSSPGSLGMATRLGHAPHCQYPIHRPPRFVSTRR